MAYYFPCKNCATDHKTCKVRAALKEAIKGHSVTSLKFTCRERVPLFNPGERVIFSWRVFEQQYTDDFVEITDKFKGTVIRESAARRGFVVRVDEDPSEHGLLPSAVFKNGGFAVLVKPACMVRLEEPPRTFCGDCLAYPGETGLCFFSEKLSPENCGAAQ